MQSRAGKGVINVKTVERNGKVVGVLSVTEDSEVILISQQGKITRLDSVFAARFAMLGVCGVIS